MILFSYKMYLEYDIKVSALFIENNLSKIHFFFRMSCNVQYFSTHGMFFFS